MSRTNFKRTARVASLLREVLTEVLRTVKDPRVSGVSVTDVEVTGDLRDAKIFIACYGDESAGQTQLEGLGKQRATLGEKLDSVSNCAQHPRFHFI